MTFPCAVCLMLSLDRSCSKSRTSARCFLSSTAFCTMWGASCEAPTHSTLASSDEDGGAREDRLKYTAGVPRGTVSSKGGAEGAGADRGEGEGVREGRA